VFIRSCFYRIGRGYGSSFGCRPVASADGHGVPAGRHGAEQRHRLRRLDGNPDYSGST